MAYIKCEICGASDLLKINDLFICQRCGTKYTAEDARKLFIDDDDQSVSQDNNEMSYSEDEPAGFPEDNSEEQVKEDSFITKHDLLPDNETDNSPIHISSVYTHLGIRPGEVVFEDAPAVVKPNGKEDNHNIDNMRSKVSLELVECVECHGLIRKEAKYCRLCGVKNRFSAENTKLNQENAKDNVLPADENKKNKQKGHEKKKRKVLISVISAIIILAIGGVVYWVTSSSLSNSKMLYDPVKSKEGNVYADIVSITPEFGIQDNKLGIIEGAVCSCKTDKGDTIWVYCSSENYRKYFSRWELFEKLPGKTVSFSHPVRIYGFVKETYKVSTYLINSINTSTVLSVLTVDQKDGK